MRESGDTLTKNRGAVNPVAPAGAGHPDGYRAWPAAQVYRPVDVQAVLPQPAHLPLNTLLKNRRIISGRK